MTREQIETLLEQVAKGELSVEQALGQMRLAPLSELGFATLDLQRALRRGFPEVVYGPGKTTAEIAEIAQRLCNAGQPLLITRVGPEVHAAVQKFLENAEYHPIARAVTVRTGELTKGRPGVTVMTAGTADRAVAEEAIVTAEAMGCQVRRVLDVGVAGLHRLLSQREALLESRVIIAVAGMEGALPSIVMGLTDCPVIGVPTSTGSGVGGRGGAALLAMLNSCAGGLTVVNVDNGFGAGYAAALINRLSEATK